MILVRINSVMLYVYEEVHRGQPSFRDSPRSRPYIKDSREIIKQTLMNQYYEY